MDPRFGQIAGNAMGLGGLLGSAEVKPTPSPTVPAAPYDPTVGEHLRDNIQHLQAQIKSLENTYLEARQLGLLDQKLHKVREIIGW